jgi:hypothetical protein
VIQAVAAVEWRSEPPEELSLVCARYIGKPVVYAESVADGLESVVCVYYCVIQPQETVMGALYCSAAVAAAVAEEHAHAKEALLALAILDAFAESERRMLEVDVCIQAAAVLFNVSGQVADPAKEDCCDSLVVLQAVAT